jgi:hypothetical protein
MKTNWTFQISQQVRMWGCVLERNCSGTFAHICSSRNLQDLRERLLDLNERLICSGQCFSKQGFPDKTAFGSICAQKRMQVSVWSASYCHILKITGICRLLTVEDPIIKLNENSFSTYLLLQANRWADTQCNFSLRLRQELSMEQSSIFFSPLAPTLEHRADFISLLIILQTVGLLGRVISSSQGLYLCTNTERRTHIRKHYKHPCPEWDSNPRSRLPSERRQCMP